MALYMPFLTQEPCFGRSQALCSHSSPLARPLPFVFIMLVTLSLTRITVGQTPEADFFW